MELTRRGLFGLVGAAAVGSVVKVATPAPVEEVPQQGNNTIIVRLDDLEMHRITRSVIKELPRQLRMQGVR